MNSYKNKIEVCVRAVIQRQGKILICQNKSKGYYFLPGGHIDFGETAKETLNRELKEELNIIVKKYSFIGTVENIFIEDGQKHHEINLVFNVSVDRLNDRSRENHISFLLMDIKEFSRKKILPVALKMALLKWCKNKKIFWASRIYNKIIS